MWRRPGLVPKKQRLESVGLGDGEGMGEEEGPIRTRCEKGERSGGSQIPDGGKGDAPERHSIQEWKGWGETEKESCLCPTPHLLA